EHESLSSQPAGDLSVDPKNTKSFLSILH
ncbi:unknown protein, partial [Waddlia chondrophila 2032/99]